MTDRLNATRTKMHHFPAHAAEAATWTIPGSGMSVTDAHPDCVHCPSNCDQFELGGNFVMHKEKP